MSDLSLASEFPAATSEAWRGLVDRVLKGADFDKKLVSRTYDGLRIEPLYQKATPAGLIGRSQPGPWRVAARLDHPDPGAANALALADLEGGADAIVLTEAGAPTGRGFGLTSLDVDGLDQALQGVMLDLVTLGLETAPFKGREAAALVTELAARRGHEPGALTIDFGLDPIGDLARSGCLPLPWPDLAKRFAETAAWLSEAGFGGSRARIDARAYHEAGASEAQELAAALATGVAYLRALEAGGHTLEAARDWLSFLLIADADEFLTVAKLRALRLLWAKVEAGCGLAPKPLRLHAETAWRSTTRRDPWVNLLRGTIAAFSAGIGGADLVTVLPFTAALGLPDAFARRLARNTQIILLEEANVWRVQDPVAGSGGFEALTEALAEEAWRLFQAIEQEGGLVESLRRGALQGRIAATRAQRDTATATRRNAITGTSEFPNIHESAVAVLLPAPGPSELASGSGPGIFDSEALPSIRVAEPYERLRDRSDEILAETGQRPRVFLANLGPLSAFTARATFAKNAFEAGGFEAIGNDGFGPLEALVDGYRASGAPLACLCSSDEIYGTQADRAAAALQNAGARGIYLAGRPGELEHDLRQAGLTGFIALGADLVQVLSLALEMASTERKSGPGPEA